MSKLKNRKRNAHHREHEPPAYLDWDELCALDARMRTDPYDGPDIPHFARLGYLAKDFRASY